MWSEKIPSVRLTKRTMKGEYSATCRVGSWKVRNLLSWVWIETINELYEKAEIRTTNFVYHNGEINCVIVRDLATAKDFIVVAKVCSGWSLLLSAAAADFSPKRPILLPVVQFSHHSFSMIAIYVFRHSVFSWPNSRWRSVRFIIQPLYTAYDTLWTNF